MFPTAFDRVARLFVGGAISTKKCALFSRGTSRKGEDLLQEMVVLARDSIVEVGWRAVHPESRQLLLLPFRMFGIYGAHWLMLYFAVMRELAIPARKIPVALPLYATDAYVFPFPRMKCYILAVVSFRHQYTSVL